MITTDTAICKALYLLSFNGTLAVNLRSVCYNHTHFTDEEAQAQGKKVVVQSRTLAVTSTDTFPSWVSHLAAV